MKLMLILIKTILVFIFLLLLPLTTLAQQDSLTLNKCVEIALKNNQQIKIGESNYYISQANYKTSKSILYPQLSYNTQMVRNGGTFFIGPITRLSYFSNYSTGFQLSQFLYDFGKSYSLISASEDLMYSTEQDLYTVQQTLILNTNIAYFNYLQSVRILDVAKEVLNQTNEHLKQANALFTVGKSAKYDVLKASTDVANANVNLITAENNLRLARLQLESNLNVKLSDNLRLQDNLEVNRDSVSLDKAVESALSNRPEIVSNKFRVHANKANLSASWSANFPTISATAGYFWRSFAINEPFPNSWNFAFTISLPLFQGFALDAGIDRARAVLQSSEAQNDYLIQNILIEVEQQYLNLQQSKEKITATNDLVNQYGELLKIAEGRYDQGVGSSLEITDARVAMYNAKTSQIQSLYDYQVNFARLKKAMGVLK